MHIFLGHFNMFSEYQVDKYTIHNPLFKESPSQEVQLTKSN